MNLVTAGSLLIAIVAGWIAVLNFWTYRLRRSDLQHLWLGSAALGGVAICIPAALIFESQTVDEARLYRTAMIFGAVPFYLSLIRFSELFLQISMPRVKRMATPAMVLSLLVTLVPGAAFESVPIVRNVVGFGISYVDVTIAPLMGVVGLGFVVLSTYIASTYIRTRFEETAEWLPLTIAGAIFLAICANDSLVGAGIIETPLLFGIGVTSLVTALTAVLSRRFVQSAGRAEEAAATLQVAAEERARALRQRDLQLAHGEALATVGTLAAGLAHEINNPIAFISANLNHLGELGHEDRTEVEFAEVLAETREGIDRVRGIVDELTRLARRGEGETEEVDLGHVIRSVLPIVRHEARGRAEIETLLEDVPAIRGDRQLIGQIVLNLVLNAIHAADGETSGRVAIATTSERPCVQLHVNDTGPGIPPEVLPRIFEAFYTTKGEGSGTGLGLAITRQLVEQHGGTIHVDTDATGTRMTVEFPAVSQPSRPRSPLRAALSPS